MKKQKYTVIVNCNLEYTLHANSYSEALKKAGDIELPKEYICGSFEIVKIIKGGE